jgi:NodT family efflux transporter outer membrane factor (OMF) lipoprotein
MPARFIGATDDGERLATDPWWETFGDTVLTQCIEEALTSNHSLRASIERVRIARAMRRVESSRFYPDVDAGVSYTVDRLSENNPRFQDAVRAGLFPRDVEYWDVGFDVTWELDVFGGTRRRVESASARIEEEEFQRRALMLSVAAEVARNYFELLGNQHRIQLIEASIANEKARVRILDLKQRVGLVSAGEVLPFRARQRQLESLVPSLKAEVRAGDYRLAVLMGRRPTASFAGRTQGRKLPQAAGQVPVGLPSDLLLRRPDVLALERRLAVATAEIGVAKAEFFPRFFLTGSPNLQSGDFTDLFSGASSAWVFGPSVQWKLFAAGRNQAQLEAARAQREQAFIEYETMVNRVLEEVESSLVRYGNGAQSLNALSQAAASRQRETEIQSMRHLNGVAEQVDVIESRSAWFDARMEELDEQVLLLTRLVNLYKALGGGWERAEAIVLSNLNPATRE